MDWDEVVGSREGFLWTLSETKVLWRTESILEFMYTRLTWYEVDEVLVASLVMFCYDGLLITFIFEKPAV